MNRRRAPWPTPRPLAPLAALALLLATSAPAAILPVNTTLDAVAADGRCSLREAISSANNDQAVFTGDGECVAGSGADTVVLGAGTYAITRAGAAEDLNVTGDFDLRSSVTLVGLGAGTTRLSGSLLDRVLHVTGGGTEVNLRQLTVALGLPPNGPAGAARSGGGLLVESDSNVLLDHVAVEFNSGGSATTTSDFGGGNGGGIHCGENVDLVLADSIVRFNTAGDALAGAGAGATIAGWGGGINGLQCDIVLERSRVVGNTSGDGNGTVSPGHGGGISLFFGGSLSLVDSVVADNATGDQGIADGGGVYVRGTRITVHSSSIVDNRAPRGGAIGGGSFLTFAPLVAVLRNATLSGNHATTGGAIHLDQGWSLALGASTAADNVASLGGAIALDDCANLLCSARTAGSAFVRNAGGDCALNGSTVNSGGYNAFEVANACAPAAATDRVITADALGPRVDDYATTPVHLPAADGPLVDGGSCTATLVTTDQAGVPRPQQHAAPDADDGCDIGAIELRVAGVFGDGFE